MSETEILETHLQELRRGTIVLACLRLLEELGKRGFPTDANTLYPLLRRLEKQGFLTSEWNTDESRPRKFYRTSDAGLRLAGALTDDFRAIAVAIDALPEEN